MGTRNLTCVKADGEYKIAQYGQWDGYPDGQGLTALRFLHETNLGDFRFKLDRLSDLTEEDKEAVNKTPNWPSVYPHLSRDAGAEILKMVRDRDITKVLLDLEFAADGLMCEWAWVIDLDANTFQAYEGFNRGEQDGRFSDLPKPERRDDYKPVGLVKTWSLDALPTEEEFLDAFKSEEEEDES